MKMERRRSRVHRQHFSREFREKKRKLSEDSELTENLRRNDERKCFSGAMVEEKKELTEIEGKLLCPLVVEEKTI